MPTQRCGVQQFDGRRCPGVFAYRLEERTPSSTVACPLCGATNYWNPCTEEWWAEPDALADW